MAPVPEPPSPGNPFDEYYSIEADAFDGFEVAGLSGAVISGKGDNSDVFPANTVKGAPSCLDTSDVVSSRGQTAPSPATKKVGEEDEEKSSAKADEMNGDDAKPTEDEFNKVKDEISTENRIIKVNNANDDPYSSCPPTQSPPPLIRLRAYGTCCPFMESEEAQASVNLQKYPIIWYRKKWDTSPKNGKDIKGGFLSKLKAFGSSKKNVKSKSKVQQSKEPANGDEYGKNGLESEKVLKKDASSKMTWEGIPATLSVVDSEEHGPVILIQTTEETDKNEDNDNKKETPIHEESWWEIPPEKNVPMKVIPLYMVHSVSAPGMWNRFSFFGNNSVGGVRLHGHADIERNDGCCVDEPLVGGCSDGFITESAGGDDIASGGRAMSSSSNGRELIRFDTMGKVADDECCSPLCGATDSMLFPVAAKEVKPNEHSDEVIRQLNSLVEWNRNRVATEVKEGKLSIVPSGKNLSYVMA